MVTQPDFEAAYRGATEEQQQAVTRFIECGDREAVQHWLAIEERNRSNIDELPVKELRRLAGSLGIAGYQYLPKASLLSQISSKELVR